MALALKKDTLTPSGGKTSNRVMDFQAGDHTMTFNLLV